MKFRADSEVESPPDSPRVRLGVAVEFVAYWRSTNDCDRKTAVPTHPMKAIRYCEYGSPDDVLKLEEVEKPVPNDNQILVRVRAVSLRFFDRGHAARRNRQPDLRTS